MTTAPTQKLWHTPIARMYVEFGLAQITHNELFAGGSEDIARFTEMLKADILLEQSDVAEINALMHTMHQEDK
jgi:hypothetical protein